MPMENLVLIGFVVIVIGIILILIGSLSGKADVKVGIGGFIGPLPFGWANDPKILPWIIALTAIIAIVFLIIVLRGGLF